MLADGEGLPVSKFYFLGAQMPDIGKVDQNHPVAEGKAPLRQHGGKVRNLCGSYDRPADQMDPRSPIPGLHIDDIRRSQPALALFRKEQDLPTLTEGFIAVQQSLPGCVRWMGFMRHRTAETS